MKASSEIRSRCLWLAIAFSAAGLMLADEDEAIGPTNQQPVASPDGSRIAFVSDSGPTKDLWIAKRDGTGAFPLTLWPSSQEAYPDWASDNKHIVFASTRGSRRFNIWTIADDGTNARQITSTSNADNIQPRYSPDGKKILFVSNRSKRRELWTMNADGSGQAVVASLQLNVADPSWSPDGTSIAFAGCAGNGFCNIFTSSIDGRQFRQVTVGMNHDWGPDWGVSGIVFTTDRNGNWGLWLVQPDGSELRPFGYANPADDLHPRWDKVSGAVLFDRTIDDAAGSMQIWSVTSGGAAKQLTHIIGFMRVGDVNGDGVVDCLDLAVVRASLGRQLGQLGFDPRADVNQDGVVDVRDLSIVAQRVPTGSKC